MNKSKTIVQRKKEFAEQALEKLKQYKCEKSINHIFADMLTQEGEYSYNFYCLMKADFMVFIVNHELSEKLSLELEMSYSEFRNYMNNEKNFYYWGFSKEEKELRYSSLQKYILWLEMQ